MGELFNIEKVFGFCEKVCYFFTVNLLFVLSNVPVLLFLLFVGAGQIRECFPLFLLCLLPLAVSLPAVMYAMNRLIGGVETGAFRDYKKEYCRDFLKKAGLGAGQLFAILLCRTNMEFFAVQLRFVPLAAVFMLLLGVTVLVTPNLYLLASRYEMGNVQIVKTAVTFLIAKPGFTLGNVVAFALILAAFEISAGTTVLFMGSVYGFLVMFMGRDIMRNLESR